MEEQKKENYRTVTARNEAWFTSWTASHRLELAGWHQDVTGEDINTFNGRDYEFALKDLSGRRLVAGILNYKDEKARWGRIRDFADAVLSGGPLEVKVLFCGVDWFEDKDTMLDKLKVDELKGREGAQVLYLYPDAETKTIGWRLFRIEDIVAHGKLREEGGKRDSFKKIPTGKEVYYFPTSLSRRGVLKDTWLSFD